MSIYFVTAIDTDAGKSIATGYMARFLQEKGQKVITQKMIQTGCQGIAEDLITHREIMGIDLLPEDTDYTTCPQVFSYPASPHLAAEIDNQPVNIEAIKNSTRLLSQKYDSILLEGAGGLHVPLNSKTNIIDYIQQEQYPVILVTSSKLGSINHTLLSIEVLKNRGIQLKGIVYNHFPQKSEFIFNDSIKIFKQFLNKWYPEAQLWELPIVNQMDECPLFEGL